MAIISNKWIDCESVEFCESVNGSSEYILRALIIPFGKVSRNGILYNRDSISSTMNQLIGLNLHHNHIFNGSSVFPRGEWFEVWEDEDGLHGSARVYDVSYNNEYLEWLRSASNIKVSLQVTGDAKQRRNDMGEYYQEAYIKNWREISTVNIPGFIDASASFSACMAECFSAESAFYEQLNSMFERYL